MSTQPATHLADMKASGVALAASPDIKVDFFSKNGFELACRIAKAFTTAEAIPSQFRQYNEKKERDGTIVLVENPAAMGNCLVAIEVSRAVGMSVTAVMQNADMINGKLRWSSKFQIAAVNSSRRFTPLKFKLQNLGRIKAKYKEKTTWNNQLRRYNFEEHEVEIENWECTAWAYELDPNGRPTKEICQSIPVTMQMAVEEGWYAKEGSKWQGAMRFQMLQYRAGTFFASIYAPDIVMGMGRSTEEEYDVIDTVQQPDGSFAMNQAVNLQELRTGQDVGSMPTTAQAPGNIDTSTGEIYESDSTSGSSAQASEGGAGAAASNPSTPSFEDAVAAVNSGDFDMARDIARSLPEGQQKSIEQAITNRMNPGQGQQRSRRERGQSGLGIE